MAIPYQEEFSGSATIRTPGPGSCKEKNKWLVRQSFEGGTKAELIDAPKQAILGEFLRSHVLSRPDVKPATLELWQQPCRNLAEFFGDDKPLRDITPGDCDDFKAWLLTQGLAPATIAKRLSFARTFACEAANFRRPLLAD